jgi:hypothetical protein
MTEDVDSDTFRLSRAEYEATWHQTFRQVFRLPKDVADQDSWAVVPDCVFREGFELAFLQRITTFEPDFMELTDFLQRIGEENFAFVSGSELDLCFAFPSDVSWKDFKKPTFST